MIAAQPGTVIGVEHERDDGSSWRESYPVVAFSDDGSPLVIDDNLVYPTELVHPDQLSNAGGRWSLRGPGELPPIVANPGWYALLVNHFDDASVPERLPVIAWRPSVDQYGGSASILCGDSAGPIDANDYAREAAESTERIGYFHPEHFLEPLEIDQLVEELRGWHLERKARRQKAPE